MHCCNQWHRNEFESGGRGHRSGAKVGGTDPAQSDGIIFFGSCPSTFFALKVQLVVLVSAFVMVSTVLSVSCLLFFYSRCPRAQPFVKVGGTCPRASMESAPLAATQYISSYYFQHGCMLLSQKNGVTVTPCTCISLCRLVPDTSSSWRDLQTCSEER